MDEEFYKAILSGSIDNVKQLVRSGRIVHENFVYYAEINEQYDILRYLLIIDTPRVPLFKYDIMLVNYYRVVKEIMNEFILSDLVPIIMSYLQKKIHPKII